MLYSLKSVSLGYKVNQRELSVISRFDLEVNENDFVALMGPSGSGKTSILNMMAGFLPPTSGKLFYRGDELYSFSPGEMAKYRNEQIGMIHQFFNLIPEMTALGNVAVPLRIKGSKRKQANERALDLLEKVGVLARADHYPSELSGGEQQRVAIARALVNEPKVVLADEPTGNLDSSTSAEIMELICGLHREGTSFVIVTHDQKVADKASKVIDMGASLAPGNIGVKSFAGKQKPIDIEMTVELN